jgi:putative transposase
MGTSVLTFKIKHSQNVVQWLKLCRKVAKKAIVDKEKRSSKYYKDVPSAISNQIIRKYCNPKYNCQNIHSVLIPFRNSTTKLEKGLLTLKAKTWKVGIPFTIPVSRVICAEVSKDFVFVTCEVENETGPLPVRTIGVDRNSTGHIAIASLEGTGQVRMLGKRCPEEHRKYKNIRKRLQRLEKTEALKKIRRRERNKQKDANHKISKELVMWAKKTESRIALEGLKGIRDNSKKKMHLKETNHNLNSWAFYELETFIRYKAKKRGVEVVSVNPYNTSKICSKCGELGIRGTTPETRKTFVCPKCGAVLHADVNAARNIASRGSLHAESTSYKYVLD